MGYWGGRRRGDGVPPWGDTRTLEMTEPMAKQALGAMLF